MFLPHCVTCEAFHAVREQTQHNWYQAHAHGTFYLSPNTGRPVTKYAWTGDEADSRATLWANSWGRTTKPHRWSCRCSEATWKVPSRFSSFVVLLTNIGESWTALHSVFLPDLPKKITVSCGLRGSIYILSRNLKKNTFLNIFILVLRRSHDISNKM